MAPASSFLGPTQRHAVGALFAAAVHQVQIHQTRLLGYHPRDDEHTKARTSGGSDSDFVSDEPELWTHENSGLLRPIFRFLGIDYVAWIGLEETAGSSTAKDQVGSFLRLLSEECDDKSSERSKQELALSKAVDTMVKSMESTMESSTKKEKHREYKIERRERCSAAEVRASIEEGKGQENTVGDKGISVDGVTMRSSTGQGNFPYDKNSNVTGNRDPRNKCDEKPMGEARMLSYKRKVTVLYELLSACLSDTGEENRISARQRKGYDARHRVALRLLATWLDIKWIHMEAIEVMLACSAMAVEKGESNEEESSSSERTWAKFKRGGIIGAAAITGGTLMAITGGLAAPAIAAGFGALAPTMGTLIPVIGASGFAAAASAAGTAAGSVAVAASFGAAGAGLTGTKVARRTGSVEEFEFKPIGENHNQGRLAVEILVSGFVFDEDDFVMPWVGQVDNLERYAIQWESKNLIAVSTAIQDWLTSRIAMGLMKQGAMLTVLSTLLLALAWPATLLAATDLIDSKWTIALDRSDKAGKLLAEVLQKGLQGYRPVTLIGYSLGARVIFKCLQYLVEAEHSTAELVERVVILGAPISIRDENWEAARRMVAGRFVNAYSTNDWTLGVAFRASLVSKGLAGIQPIEVPGIENVDVTDLVEGHSSYLWATQEILDRLELETYYPVFGEDP